MECGVCSSKNGMQAVHIQRKAPDQKSFSEQRTLAMSSRGEEKGLRSLVEGREQPRPRKWHVLLQFS